MDATLSLDEWAGRSCEVVIDRPLGSRHPRHPDIVYGINYGFVPGTLAPDGEPLDVYVVGPMAALESCKATVIAIVRRRDDIEDKLVASTTPQRWTAEEIAAAVAFQEQYFDSWIEMADGPPC